MPITREVRSSARLANPAIYHLGQLSTAERLFLWRHRFDGRSRGNLGLTQVEAAAKLGINANRYIQLEKGKRAALSVDDTTALHRAVGVFTPTMSELCLLARRRSGLMLSDIVLEFDGSRALFNSLEREGSPRLVAFWENRGFRFPKLATRGLHLT
jgi:transcriptional regulator with XRE-family HTH domain